MDHARRFTIALATLVIGGLFLIVLRPLITTIAAVSYSWYSAWLRGYSTVVCEVHTSGDAVSPSGRWTARIERGDGCDFGPDRWIDVALIPNDRPRFLARHRWMFYRSLGGAHPGSDRIAIRWVNDYALEIDTPTCVSACKRWDESSKTFVLTGAQPCETECGSVPTFAGITISVKSPGNPGEP